MSERLDVLEQIEDWARLAFARGDLTQAELDDVLALVEIAKTAQRVFEEAPYLDGPEKEALRAALARLGSPAGEDA